MPKPLYVLHGQIKTPPMSAAARITVGYQLRRVQDGEKLSMPDSRPMPEIAPNCHELRIDDIELRISWRVIYMIDDVAILVVDVFKKSSQSTPEAVKRSCRERIERYLRAKEEAK